MVSGIGSDFYEGFFLAEVKFLVGITEKKNFKVALKKESILSSQILLRITFHYMSKYKNVHRCWLILKNKLLLYLIQCDQSDMIEAMAMT